MVKEVTRYETEDGKAFDTFEEAISHERVQTLTNLLEQFEGRYAEDSFDTEAAAKWLLENYSMERKQC